MASDRNAEGAQRALDRATVRDRDTTARLRKAVEATVSSLLLAGYDRAEVADTIRGFMLNALAAAPVRAPVVDAILTDAEMWAERRLETRYPRPRLARNR